MKKTPRESKSPSSTKRDTLRRHLHEALSDDERDVVLAAALLTLDAAGRERLLDGLDADTRDALGSVLNPPTKTAARPGRRKVEQEWNARWARWDEIVEASGDEEGEYVHKDRPWDTPYTDRASVAGDLDAVAAQLRALMPAVIAADLAPDLRFTEIVEDLDDELGSGLPDWMGSAGDEEYLLGAETTRLFLEWDWAMEQASGVARADFLDGWREVEGSLAHVRLHAASIDGFGSAKRPAARPRGSTSKGRSRA
jgi:hypothetical protein